MAGYRKADGLFTNATTKNDQIDRQRSTLRTSNDTFSRSQDLGVGSDTSNIFTGFNADQILEDSTAVFNALDFSSNLPSGNPDFEGTVIMDSTGIGASFYSDIGNVKDKPNEKGPNLLVPDINQVIQGSVPDASDTINTRFENKGFGWRDDRNEPGNIAATIGQYFSKHYNSTGASNDKPVLGEAKDLGDDPIDYKQP